MENLVNSIYALQVTLQGFVLIQMIVTDVDKAASGKPGTIWFKDSASSSVMGSSSSKCSSCFFNGSVKPRSPLKGRNCLARLFFKGFTSLSYVMACIAPHYDRLSEYFVFLRWTGGVSLYRAGWHFFQSVFLWKL